MKPAKQRAVITTLSGSIYIWSPARDAFFKADGEHQLMDLDFSGRIVAGERLVVHGAMWCPDRRQWIPSSKLTTSVVRSVEWEPDWSCVPGSLGPVRVPR